MSNLATIHNSHSLTLTPNLTAFIERQNSEKQFLTALTQTIATAVSAESLPLDFKLFVSDYLVENKSKYLLAATKSAAIEFCLIVLKTFDSNTEELLPSWVNTTLQVLGEVFDSLDSDRGGKSGKLLQISTTRVGLFLQTR
jgi:hypothetical protein